MKTRRQVMRDARRLWRMCLVNGTVDERRTRTMLGVAISSNRRGSAAVLAQVLRLLKLDRARHVAEVASAVPLDARTRGAIEKMLAHHHDRRIAATFVVDPLLIGGLRITVGSEVCDGTVLAALTALEARF
jgi:F-type H+-transporting ATPase subunit delta